MNTRDLSIFEYAYNLQKEYICAEIRLKIFQKKYRSYWTRVMSGKKAKIEDITTRNSLNNIFTSREEYLEVYSKIVPEWGAPSFTYRDEAQRDRLGKWDRIYFFNNSAEVKVLTEDNKIAIGTILDNSLCSAEYPTVVVKIKGLEKSLPIPLKRVSRIL